jgi:hypothetical protein
MTMTYYCIQASGICYLMAKAALGSKVVVNFMDIYDVGEC